MFHGTVGRRWSTKSLVCTGVRGDLVLDSVLDVNEQVVDCVMSCVIQSDF